MPLAKHGMTAPVLNLMPPPLVVVVYFAQILNFEEDLLKLCSQPATAKADYLLTLPALIKRVNDLFP